MADLDKIKAKLKALRAKTVDNGRTEEEALLAAEKMTEMLSKYGISAEELDAVDYGKNAVRLGRRSPLDDIWSAVARFADCKGWYERDGGKLDFVFFGRVQDTLVAEYVYEVLKSACAKALADFRTTDLYLRRRTTKTRARAVRSFQEGLAGRLCAKLREGLWRRYWAGTSAATDKALVLATGLLDTALDTHGVTLRPSRPLKSPKGRLAEDASIHGRRAADAIDVQAGVANAGQPVAGLLRC